MSSSTPEHVVAEFIAIATLPPPPSNDRHHPIFQRNAKQIAEPALAVLHTIPVAGEAVLDFVAFLVHETVNVTLVQFEQQNSKDASDSVAVDVSAVEDALQQLFDALRSVVLTDSAKWLETAFNFATTLIAQVGKRHMGCRPSVPNATALNELLQIFTSCRGSKFTLEFIEFCVQEMLAKPATAQSCVTAILNLSLDYGQSFDWVLTYIGTQHPAAIVNELLSVGRSALSEHVKQQRTPPNPQAIEAYRARVYSIARIISHLTTRSKNPEELRNAFTACVKKGLEATGQSVLNYSIPFVLQLFCCAPELADLTLDDLLPCLTIPNMLRAQRDLAAVPCQYLSVLRAGQQDAVTIQSLLLDVLLRLDADNIAKVFDVLLTFVVEKVGPSRIRDAQALEQRIYMLLDIVLDRMEQHSHSRPLLLPEDVPVLRLVGRTLPHILTQLRTSAASRSVESNKSKLQFRMVNLYAAVSGEPVTVEILTHLLFKSANERELTVFVSYCNALLPYHPSAIDSVIRRIPSSEAGDRKSVDVAWIRNMRQLLQWEQSGVQSAEFLKIMVPLQHHFTSIATILLEVAADSSYGANEDHPSLQSIILDIFTSISPQSLKLSASDLCLTISLFVEHCWRLVMRADIDREESLQDVFAFEDYILSFLSAHASSYSFETVVNVLLSYCIPLTDSATDVTDLDTDHSQLPKSNQSDEPPPMDCSKSLMQENLTLESIGPRGCKVAKFMHSGTLSLKPNRSNHRTASATISAAVQLRRQLVFDLFDRCLERCVDSRRSALVQSMLHTICRRMTMVDATTGTISWESMAFVRANVERYLTVASKLRRHSFVWDLVELAHSYDSSYETVALAVPLLKASLVFASTRLDSTLTRKECPPSGVVETMAEAIPLLMRISPQAPRAFYVIPEMLPHIAIYEAQTIMRDVWMYCQNNIMSTEPQTKEVLECAGLYNEHIRLVMIAHISEFSHLFSKAFDLTDAA